jgi:hypothetical protein
MPYQIFSLPEQAVLSATEALRLLPGAKAYFFASGTTTPQDTFSDADLTIPHANPVEADSAGFLPTIYLNAEESYRCQIKTAADVLISDTDPVNDSVLSALAIAALIKPQTPAELSADVTPANLLVDPYKRGRYTNAVDWRLACDEAGAEGELDADYPDAAAADVYLPDKCNFKGFQITGSHYTIHDGRRGGWVKGWRALKVQISNAYFCQYDGVDTGLADLGSIEINGGPNGVAWCSIQVTYSRRAIFNNSTGYVNHNKLHGGICRYVHFTGDNAIDLHSNMLEHLDVTKNGSGDEWGILQDPNLTQSNFASHIYYEAGSDIAGPFTIFNLQADANVAPRIGRFNHLLGTVGVNQQTRGDYLSLGLQNLAVGGEWDVLDTSSKPPCLSHSGGASVSIQADSTVPGGIGYRWQVTLEQAFDNITITFNTGGESFFTAVIDVYAATAFPAITTYGPISAEVSPSTYGMPTGWRRYRISGGANTSGDSSIVMGVAGDAITPTAFSIGGVFVTAEKACPSPTKPSKVMGAYSIADGGTISHTLGREPTVAIASTRTAGEIASVTARSSTTITVAIKTHAGAAGTTQVIDWMVA